MLFCIVAKLRIIKLRDCAILIKGTITFQSLVYTYVKFSLWPSPFSSMGIVSNLPGNVSPNFSNDVLFNSSCRAENLLLSESKRAGSSKQALLCMNPAGKG